MFGLGALELYVCHGVPLALCPLTVRRGCLPACQPPETRCVSACRRPVEPVPAVVPTPVPRWWLRSYDLELELALNAGTRAAFWSEPKQLPLGAGLMVERAGSPMGLAQRLWSLLERGGQSCAN